MLATRKCAVHTVNIKRKICLQSKLYTTAIIILWLTVKVNVRLMKQSVLNLNDCKLLAHFIMT